MTRRLLGLLALGMTVSCGPENGLSGSLGEVFPLDISRVEAARNLEAFQVTYFRNRGVFLDVVVRVSVSLAGVEMKPGVKVDLAGEYDPGHPRCVVTTAPGGEPVRVLPRVKRGDFVISSGGEPGGVSRGNFSMLFEAEGGDVGFGRTLGGTFATMTSDAGFGEIQP